MLEMENERKWLFLVFSYQIVLNAQPQTIFFLQFFSYRLEKLQSFETSGVLDTKW